MTTTAKHMINISRYSFIVLWGYAASIKLWNWEQSQREMHLQTFPSWIGDILFWLIPTIELLLVYLLINQHRVMCGIKRSVILLSSFTLHLTLASNKVFGKIPCACGGILSNMFHWQHIVFNLLFIAVGIITLVLAHNGRQGDVLHHARRKEGKILS